MARHQRRAAGDELGRPDGVPDRSAGGRPTFSGSSGDVVGHRLHERLRPPGRRPHWPGARRPGRDAFALDDDALELDGTVVDLRGGMLVPAFRDGHVHPLWGGVDLGRLPLDHCLDVDAVARAVADYADAHPELPWIIGGPYRFDVPPGDGPKRGGSMPRWRTDRSSSRRTTTTRCG